MEKLLHNKNTKKVIFVVVICLQIIWAFYWCSKKEGIYIDEGFTFILSNSEMKPFLEQSDDFYNTWHSAGYFEDAVTVNEDDRFALLSVINNQAKDVHPPLYYFIINFLSSLYLGRFSFWIGLIPNLLFYAITIVFVYLIVQEATKNFYFSVLSEFIYGVSVGAIATVMLIRMYMLLTMIIVASVYCHIKYIKYRHSRNKYFKIILLLTLAGALTQYYFFIYHVVITCVLGVFLIIEKNYRRLLDIVFGYIILAGLYVLMWPYFFSQVFGEATDNGYRGKEAIENISNARDGSYIFDVLRYCSNEIMVGLGVIILVFLGIMIVLTVRKRERLSNKAEACCAFFPFILYFLVVIKIMPDPFYGVAGLPVRYFWPVYPLLVCFLVIIVWNYIGKNKLKFLAMGLMTVLTIFCYLIPSNTNYYIEYKNTGDIIREAKKYNSAIIITDGNAINKIIDVVVKARFEQIYCVKPNDLEDVLKNDSRIEGNSTAMIVATDMSSMGYSSINPDKEANSRMFEQMGNKKVKYIDGALGVLDLYEIGE